VDQDQIDQKWMQYCLELATQAGLRGEVPIGAVVVQGDEIIGEGANHREVDQTPLGHAEIMAISQASQKLKSWRLLNSTLYVTLEPCPMCAGAILQARIPRVVYGARDLKAGSVHSLYELLTDSRLNHRCEVVSGILEKETSEQLKGFFKALRQKTSSES
jgi:tRNA(adenine34) deaminase